MLDSGRETEAIAHLEAAVPEEPTSASLRILLARAYERVGRLNQAMDAWSTALFLAPESNTARSGVRRLRRSYPDLQPATAPITTPAPSEPEAYESDEVARSSSQIDLESSEDLEPGVDARPETLTPETEENLDRLIRELETARIVPDPDFEAEPIEFDDEEEEGLVSETLARIYAAQQQYSEAAQVYEVLADQQPERAEEFRLKAQEMKMRGRS